MVDFKTPDLPGASAVYNKIASKVDEVEKSVMGKLESTASDLKAALEPDLLDLKDKVQGMIPELPTLPSLNLQSEISALSGLVAGSGAYAAKLASIGTSFGSAISSGGYNLDTIASAGASALKEASSIAAGGLASLTGGLPSVSSLAAAIPNMELPFGATDAIEIAKASMQPDTDVLKEAASAFSIDKAEDLVKGIFGDAIALETLESDMAALEAKIKPYAEAFEAKAKRWDQQLKESNATMREEDLVSGDF
jgi:hypothetical protein